MLRLTGPIRKQLHIVIKVIDVVARLASSRGLTLVLDTLTEKLLLLHHIVGVALIL